MSALALFLLVLGVHAEVWAAPTAPVAPLEVNTFDANTPGGGVGAEQHVRGGQGEQSRESARKLPGSDEIVGNSGFHDSTDRPPPAQNLRDLGKPPPGPYLRNGSPAYSYKGLDLSVGTRKAPGFSLPAGGPGNGSPGDPRRYFLTGAKQPASANTDLESPDALNGQVPFLARIPINHSDAVKEEAGSHQGRENFPQLSDSKISSDFLQQHADLGVNASPAARAKGGVTSLKNSVFRELFNSIPPVPADPASRQIESRAGSHHGNTSLTDADEPSQGLFRSRHPPREWSGPPGGAGRDAQVSSSLLARLENPRDSSGGYQSRDLFTSYNKDQLDVLQNPYEIRQPQNPSGVHRGQGRDPYPGYLVQNTGYPLRPAYVTSPEFSHVASYRDSHQPASGNPYLEQSHPPVSRAYAPDSTDTGHAPDTSLQNPQNEDEAALPDGETFSRTPHAGFERPEPRANVSHSSEFVRQTGQRSGAEGQPFLGLSLTDRRLSPHTPYSFVENDDFRPGAGQKGERGYRKGQGESTYRQGQGQEDRPPNRFSPFLEHGAVDRLPDSALLTTHYSDPRALPGDPRQSSRTPPGMQGGDRYPSSPFDGQDERNDLDVNPADRRRDIRLNGDSREDFAPGRGAVTLDLRLGDTAGSRDNTGVYPTFSVGSRDSTANYRRHEPFLSDENVFTGYGSGSYQLSAEPRAGYSSARDTQQAVGEGPGTAGAEGRYYFPQGGGNALYTLPRAGAGAKGSEFAPTTGRIHYGPSGQRLPQAASRGPQAGLRFALDARSNMAAEYPQEARGLPTARYSAGRSSSHDGEPVSDYGKDFNNRVLFASYPAPRGADSPHSGPEVGVAVVKGRGMLTDPVLSRTDLHDASRARSDRPEGASQQSADTGASFPEGSAIFLGKLPASSKVSP